VAAGDPPARIDPDRLADAIALLEELGGDLRTLAQLDEPVRIRLVSAAGQLSRPDRYSRRALGKQLMRSRAAARRDADQAALEQTGIRALRKEPVFRTPLPMPDVALDAPLQGEGDPVDDDGGWAAAEAAREVAELGAAPALDEAPEAFAPPDPAAPGVRRVVEPRFCYVCKTDFHELHDFYDQLCPPCAAFNWQKRNQTADLTGRVVMVTGARVKIGYQAAIMLLRAGAEVVVATRFPRDAARRFAREADATAWQARLHVYGVDLRHTPSVELLCAHLCATLPRLDGLINNACQTVRRPAGWYDHVVVGEDAAWRSLAPAEQAMLERNFALRGQITGELPEGLGGADGPRPDALARAAGAEIQATGLWRSAVLSQVPLLAEDLGRDHALFPAGRLDADLQQVDLRATNSWRMTLADVPTAELLEVQLVNAIAPFVLNARLRPLLAKVPTRDAHVVNVSAMEGQFYRRWKTDKHPHTNMAKAALNMMTRTSAIDYVKDGIHMNSVDTGWVTDEDPVHHAARKTAVHGFHPPLDIVDGAARIVDPLFDGINTGNHLWGLFLKDYKAAPW
jgi:NAD(P)-dependent dehydrogenase (short-subunit alcohol dehydrogenase family)